MGRVSPDRHPQADFFIPDIFDALSFKDDMASMEHPLYSVGSRPDMRTLQYQYGDVSIEMQPSALGLPTIFDKDVLLYCGSLMMDAINKGETPSKKMKISVHDLLIATKRDTSKRGYDMIKRAFNRLTGALVKTNIKTGRRSQESYFHILEKATFIESERHKGRVIGLEIELSDWFYNSLLAKQVLTISPKYFQLRKAIDRRLYEISRKHCGMSKQWSIGLESLQSKTGSTGQLKRFRHTIRELIIEQHERRDCVLPDFVVMFDSATDMVTFINLKKWKKQPIKKAETSNQTNIPHHIPPHLLDKVRTHVGIGLDYYPIWEAFKAFNQGKKLESLDGAFIGFSRMKAIEAMQGQ